MHRTLARFVLPCLAMAAAFALGGCGPTYVNPSIANKADAKQRLEADTAICKQEADMAVAPTYGLERFESDPTIEAQATRWVANVAEDDANLDVFATCMRDRGWRFKK